MKRELLQLRLGAQVGTGEHFLCMLSSKVFIGRPLRGGCDPVPKETAEARTHELPQITQSIHLGLLTMVMGLGTVM